QVLDVPLRRDPELARRLGVPARPGGAPAAAGRGAAAQVAPGHGARSRPTQDLRRLARGEARLPAPVEPAPGPLVEHLQLHRGVPGDALVPPERAPFAD